VGIKEEKIVDLSESLAKIGESVVFGWLLFGQLHLTTSPPHE